MLALLALKREPPPASVLQVPKILADFLEWLASGDGSTSEYFVVAVKHVRTFHISILHCIQGGPLASLKGCQF